MVGSEPREREWVKTTRRRLEGRKVSERETGRKGAREQHDTWRSCGGRERNESRREQHGAVSEGRQAREEEQLKRAGVRWVPEQDKRELHYCLRFNFFYFVCCKSSKRSVPNLFHPKQRLFFLHSSSHLPPLSFLLSSGWGKCIGVNKTQTRSTNSFRFYDSLIRKWHIVKDLKKEYTIMNIVFFLQGLILK